MCVALAALFSIVVAASMAYKMMVNHELLDVMKLFKPLVISIILCWWYPSAGLVFHCRWLPDDCPECLAL